MNDRIDQRLRSEVERSRMLYGQQFVSHFRLIGPRDKQQSLVESLEFIESRFKDDYLFKMCHRYIDGFCYTESNFFSSFQTPIEWLLWNKENLFVKPESVLFFLFTRAILMRFLAAGIEPNLFTKYSIRRRAQDLARRKMWALFNIKMSAATN